ncbi:MAG TPA: hypothetical protein VF932_12565 [Anaerolineae bacterium]
MDGGNDFFKRIFGWLPAWVGFGIIILIGVLALIFGATARPNPSAGLLAFGVAAIASAILAWVVGARATPQLNPFEPSFGAIVDKIDGWAWLVVFGLFLIAILIAVFVH